MGKRAQTSPRSVGNKTTLMDRRIKKPANQTGKGKMVYPKGVHK